MKNWFFAFVLLSFASLSFADTFTTSVSTYAQQYERGEINLLQFNVLLTTEREKLFKSLNARVINISSEKPNDHEGEWQEMGWDQNQMHSIFGEPTQQEAWAWSPISRKSVKLTALAPAWRKVLYNGEKIRVIVDSSPEVIERDGGSFLFYHFELRPEFKRDLNFNMGLIGNEFKTAFQEARGNDEKLKEAALKSVEIEQSLNDYLRENKLSCKESLQSWFGQQGGISNKLKWNAVVYSGKFITLRLSGDEWTDQNWHGFNSWIELDQRAVEMRDLPSRSDEKVNPVMLPTLSAYISKMREVLNELKRTGANFDLNPTNQNLQHAQKLSNDYQQILNELMNRVGRGELEAATSEQVIAEMERIFTEQSDFTKENVKEFEFKQSLFNLTKAKTSSYCSQKEDQAICGESQTCSNAACIPSTCDIKCGECQYADRTSCTCIKIKQCVPQPRGEQQQPDWASQDQNQTQQNRVYDQNTPDQFNNNETTETPRDVQGQNASVQTASTVQSNRNNTNFTNFSISPFTGLEVNPPSPQSQTPVQNDQQWQKQICPDSCSINQFCTPEKGWCECKQGFFDCDGDWQNGCESSKQCKECKQNSDCAPARCSEDNGRVVQFQCKQGDSFIEQVASAELGGSCAERNSGEIEPHVWISAWGEGFENFDQYKQSAWSTSDKTHCAVELEDATKKRLELQASLNDEFFKWFFAKIVTENPGDFEKQGRSIGAVYEAFQHNSDDTARALRCLGRTDWPTEYKEVHAEVKTEFGKVQLWEERKRTNFWGTEQEVFSPYLKMWVFPTKQMFKKFFVAKIKEEGPKGPTPEELAEMRQSPQAMEKIKKIASAFGGDARIIVQAVDEGQSVVKFIFIVNDHDLIKIEPAETYSGPVSATVSVSLDFIYDLVSSQMKEMDGEHLQVPYWEEHKEPSRVVNDGIVVVKIFGRIFSGILNGEISINPPSALPKIVFILQEMMTMIMSEGISS